jgi:ectoine hydroxylase-related dioxygenase (phytanoyl-CoA dioxygenase family)
MEAKNGPRGGHTWRRNSGWHADNSNIVPTTNDGVLPAVEIKIFFTLFDMSTSNCGNLWLVPRSHRRPYADLKQWQADNEVGAVELRLPAGAAVVWRTAVWHRVGRNLSGRVRRVLHFGYNLRWLRPGDYIRQPTELLDRCSPLRYVGWFDVCALS